MNCLKAAFAATIALLAQAAGLSAQSYPSRPVRIVVPYAAGGPNDIVARAIGEYMARDLKQSFFVENRVGAQGSIGADAAAKADPDGYTLFLTSGSIVVMNPLLYPKLPYDPKRDFRVLSILTEVPVVLEVNPKVPAKTVQEFVALAKRPGSDLSFGSAGAGGTLHLAAEMFKLSAGIEATHVPYRGVAPALTDLMSGNIQFMFDTLSTSLPHIQSGAFRPLAVASKERIKALPDLPTVAESGYPDYRVTVWYGLVGQAKLPDEAVRTLKTSMDKAMNDPAFREPLEKTLYVVQAPRSQAEIDRYVDEDVALWKHVIETRKIKLD